MLTNKPNMFSRKSQERELAERPTKVSDILSFSGEGSGKGTPLADEKAAEKTDTSSAPIALGEPVE